MEKARSNLKITSTGKVEMGSYKIEYYADVKLGIFG